MSQKEAIMQALMKAMGSSPSAPATSPRPKPRPRMGMGRAGASFMGEAGKTISDADRQRIMGMMGESGKTISDADRQRAMDRAGMLEALEAGEMGMMSPIELERLRRQLGMSRKKPAQFNGGGAVSTKAKKKPKKGCVMKGRGGNFKGLK